MASDPVEYIFVDESGDPGPQGTASYILVCLHVDAGTLSAVQTHLDSFRYHNGVKGEMKNWGGLLKEAPRQITRGLLNFLVQITEADGIRATANWLNKARYMANGGPHLGGSSPTHWFQNYQLRRLLGRHQARNPWGDQTDLVLDRWPMTVDQRRNLRQYLMTKCDLAPPPAFITVADSLYVPALDLADFYARLVRRVTDGGADPEYVSFCDALMSVKEITGGLF